MSTLALGATIIVSVLGALGGVDLIRSHISGRPRAGWTFIIPNSGTAEKINDGPLRRVRHWTLRPLGGQEMYEVKARVWGMGADLRKVGDHPSPKMYRPVMRTGDDTIEMEVVIDDQPSADVWVGVVWTEHHGRSLMEHAQCRQVYPFGQESVVQVWQPYARWRVAVRRWVARRRGRPIPPNGRWKEIGTERTATVGPESLTPPVRELPK